MVRKTQDHAKSIKHLYHPLCHIFNGERLYYFLISIDSKINDTIDDIMKHLTELHINKSSCGYVIFGDSDLILRIWAEEMLYTQVKDFLINHVSIIKVKIFVIDQINTWYQRKIEGNKEWITEFNNDYSKICNGIFPKALKYPYEFKKDRNITRFFILFEHTYTTRPQIFENLLTLIKSDSIPFNRIDRVSLYSFNTKDFQGVWLKAQAKKIEYINDLVLDLNDIKYDQIPKNIHSTTYICSKRILEESDELNVYDPPPHQDYKNKRIIYNLVKTYDCNEEIISNEISGRSCNDKFQDDFSKYLNLFSYYHDEWWMHISHFRRVFKWVVFQKNDSLLPFLMMQFVQYEKYFRDDFQRFFVLIKPESDYMYEKISSRIDTISSKKSPKQTDDFLTKDVKKVIKEEFSFTQKHYTYNDIVKNLTKLAKPQIINTFCEQHNIKTLDKIVFDNIHKVIRAFENCRQNRNDIMHGTVTNLFKVNNSATENNLVWNGFVVPLFILIFTFHKYKEDIIAFQKILTKILKITEKTNTKLV